MFRPLSVIPFDRWWERFNRLHDFIAANAHSAQVATALRALFMIAAAGNGLWLIYVLAAYALLIRDTEVLSKLWLVHALGGCVSLALLCVSAIRIVRRFCLWPNRNAADHLPLLPIDESMIPPSASAGGDELDGDDSAEFPGSAAAIADSIASYKLHSSAVIHAAAATSGGGGGAGAALHLLIRPRADVYCDSLLRAPDACANIIISFIPGRDVARAMGVCIEWRRRLIHESVWWSLCRRDLAVHTTHTLPRFPGSYQSKIEYRALAGAEKDRYWARQLKVSNQYTARTAPPTAATTAASLSIEEKERHWAQQLAAKTAAATAAATASAAAVSSETSAGSTGADVSVAVSTQPPNMNYYSFPVSVIASASGSSGLSTPIVPQLFRSIYAQSPPPLYAPPPSVMPLWNGPVPEAETFAEADARERERREYVNRHRFTRSGLEDELRTFVDRFGVPHNSHIESYWQRVHFPYVIVPVCLTLLALYAIGWRIVLYIAYHFLPPGFCYVLAQGLAFNRCLRISSYVVWAAALLFLQNCYGFHYFYVPSATAGDAGFTYLAVLFGTRFVLPFCVLEHFVEHATYHFSSRAMRETMERPRFEFLGILRNPKRWLEDGGFFWDRYPEHAWILASIAFEIVYRFIYYFAAASGDSPDIGAYPLRLTEEEPFYLSYIATMTRYGPNSNGFEYRCYRGRNATEVARDGVAAVTARCLAAYAAASAAARNSSVVLESVGTAVANATTEGVQPVITARVALWSLWSMYAFALSWLLELIRIALACYVVASGMVLVFSYPPISGAAATSEDRLHCSAQSTAVARAGAWIDHTFLWLCTDLPVPTDSTARSPPFILVRTTGICRTILNYARHFVTRSIQHCLVPAQFDRAGSSIGGGAMSHATRMDRTFADGACALLLVFVACTLLAGLDIVLAAAAAVAPPEVFDCGIDVTGLAGALAAGGLNDRYMIPFLVGWGVPIAVLLWIIVASRILIAYALKTRARQRLSVWFQLVSARSRATLSACGAELCVAAIVVWSMIWLGPPTRFESVGFSGRAASESVVFSSFFHGFTWAGVIIVWSGVALASFVN